MFTEFDKSGREPRPIQTQALEWLQNNWTSKILAIQAPTGVGKSAVARAVQSEAGAHVIVTSNVLMDQYTDTYTTVNSLKGKAHYSCNDLGVSCEDAAEIMGCKEGCPYQVARARAEDEPTFFNPYSLFFFNMMNEKLKPRVLVIDEAHKLKDVIMGMAGKSFNSRKHDVPSSLADVSIEEWLGDCETQLRQQARECGQAGDNKKALTLQNEAQSIHFVKQGFIENPENYAIDLKKQSNGSRSLTIQPISPPRYIANRLLKSSKLILLSATLLQSDIREILGHDDFKYLDLPSPIPKEHRQIKYVPAPFPMNALTPGEKVAEEINKLLEKHKGENTIIHATYALADRIAKYLPSDIIRNTSENKDEKIKEFKTKGGVFLASGCSEGVDLPGDVCRVNIIPLLYRLNIGDPVIKKRLAKEDGRTWYNYETIKALIQQAGRTTRGAEDYSITYCLDPALPRLLLDRSLQIPQSLRESLIWTLN
jgi:ATP-dependent DNA helicase DinG